MCAEMVGLAVWGGRGQAMVLGGLKIPGTKAVSP